MSINYESTSIGEVRCSQVSAVPGVGVSVLRFTLNWSMHPKRNQQVFTVFGTHLRVLVAPEGGAPPQFLGHAIPEVAWCTESREGIPFDVPLMYLLSIPAEQMLALEQLRQGRGLNFTIEVRGNAVSPPHGTRQVHDTLQVGVPVSEWIRILREAAVADILLVGVSLPIASESTSMASSLELVRRAHELLLRGEYDSSVGMCRRALDSVWNGYGLAGAAGAARKALATMDDRKAMTKRDRQLALGEAIRNFTHPAHHVGESGDPEIFSKLDAALAVGCTAAIVSSIAVGADQPSS